MRWPRRTRMRNGCAGPRSLCGQDARVPGVPFPSRIIRSPRRNRFKRGTGFSTMPPPAPRRIPDTCPLDSHHVSIRASLRGSAARRGRRRGPDPRPWPSAGARSGARCARRGPRGRRRRRRRRPGGARSDDRGPGPRADRAVARSPVQPHRDGAAHQPRARAAPGRSHRGDDRRGPGREQPRVRPRDGTARGPAPARRAAAAPAHRRRGRDRRQQQRGRGAAGPRHPREAQGGPGLAGRAHRDRRRVPHARHHEAGGGEARGGGDHEPHPSCATTRPRSERAPRC